MLYISTTLVAGLTQPANVTYEPRRRAQLQRTAKHIIITCVSMSWFNFEQELPVAESQAQ
jgi:hypothetical protein